jgi:CBS domain-containing protein
MLVKDVMTKNPACCTSQTSLEEVAQMMVENDCG